MPPTDARPAPKHGRYLPPGTKPSIRHFTSNPRVVLESETRAQVRACIDRLPDNYRTVLLLRDIEERSTQDVADALSMTATAVKVRLHRARQALSTLLRQEYARPQAGA